MTSNQRVAIALRGGKPDRVPIVPIFDAGYICRSTGRDLRVLGTCSGAERIAAIEECFLRHPGLDGLHVNSGCSEHRGRNLRIEKLSTHWRITNTDTGEQWGLRPDASACQSDGALQPHEEIQEPRVNGVEDVCRLIPAPPTAAEIEASGRFGPLRHLVAKYPDRHYSYPSHSLMGVALDACGGFAAGLTLLATDRRLFEKLLRRWAEHECAIVASAKDAGADSMWLISYFAGADTISPRDYAELVFPCELEICREARRQGLFVLDWYLGDLMPNLDQVMKLPIDALVLEQGRKGYEIDPVRLRPLVGHRFCLFGYVFERDLCTFNRQGLSLEFSRQLSGAGLDGAFVAGAPIIPPDANPEALDFYFQEVHRLGKYR